MLKIVASTQNRPKNIQVSSSVWTYKPGINEDGVLSVVFDHFQLILAIDGVGGRTRSYLATKILLEVVTKELPGLNDIFPDTEDPKHSFDVFIHNLFNRALERIQNEAPGAACCFMLCFVHKGVAYFYQSGDCGALIITDGKVVFESADDSPSQALYEHNLKTIDEAVTQNLSFDTFPFKTLAFMTQHDSIFSEASAASLQKAFNKILPPCDQITIDSYDTLKLAITTYHRNPFSGRNFINNALGFEHTTFQTVKYYSRPVTQNSTVLVYTDGLGDNLDSHQIAICVNKTLTVPEALVELRKRLDGARRGPSFKKDDVGIAILRDYSEPKTGILDSGAGASSFKKDDAILPDYSEPQAIVKEQLNPSEWQQTITLAVITYTENALHNVVTDAISDLVRLLEDNSNNMRAHAAYVLGDLADHQTAVVVHGEALFTKLVSLLGDSSELVRENAAYALARLAIRSESQSAMRQLAPSEWQQIVIYTSHTLSEDDFHKVCTAAIKNGELPLTETIEKLALDDKTLNKLFLYLLSQPLTAEEMGKVQACVKKIATPHSLRLLYLAAINSSKLGNTQVVNIVINAELALSAEAFAIVLRAAIANGNLHQTTKTAMRVKLTICTGLFSDAASLKDINPTEIKRCIMSEFKDNHARLKDRQELDALFLDILGHPFFYLMRVCFQAYNVTDTKGAYLRPNRHKLAQAIMDGTTAKVLFGSCCTPASSVTAQLSLALQDMGRT